MTSLGVEIEVFETWPPNLLKLLEENKSFLIDYQQQELEISRLCQKDIFARVNPPKNPHKDRYEALEEESNDILCKLSIIGFHCTRLTPREIKEIGDQGVKILSDDLVRYRLDQAHKDGFLDYNQYKYLSESDVIRGNLNGECGERKGMLWFCPNRSTLQEDDAVFRLFRSWGGEAVYNGHEEDEKISKTLANIGTPSIIKCSIPLNDICHFHQKFGGLFLSFGVRDKIENPEPYYVFDMHVKRDLASNEVVNIIQLDEKEFEDLTNYKNWHKFCRIA